MKWATDEEIKNYERGAYHYDQLGILLGSIYKVHLGNVSNIPYIFWHEYALTIQQSCLNKGLNTVIPQIVPAL